YDLKNLFVGAEGTLGIITAAVLKLFPAPKAAETALVGVPSVEAALALLALVQERTNRAATTFEIVSRIAVEFAVRHGHGVRDPLDQPHPWYVLAQLSPAAAAGSAHNGWGGGGNRDGARFRRRGRRPRQLRPPPRLLASARDPPRDAEAGRRLHQARHLGPARRRPGFSARSQRRRRAA